MKDWFLNLAPRERLFVLAGVIVVAILVVWAALLGPLYKAADAAEARVETKRETLGLLRTAAAEIASAGNLPADRPDLAGQSLVVIVDRSARSAGLGTALTRNQPVGEDGIRVRLENAPFDDVARWLGTINAGSGLAIESASFDRTADSGKVNASLVFRQSLQ